MIRKSLALLVLAPLATGCATMLAGLFDDPAREMSNALAVQNPAKTGKVDPQPVRSPLGSARMLTYDKGTGTLCFEVESEAMLTDGFEHSLKSFAAPTKEIEQAKGVKAATVLRKSSRSEVYSYQDTEKTTYKDSSGRQVATAETPVTRTGVKEVGIYHLCFKDPAIPDPKSRYIVLMHRYDTLLGASNYRETWQLVE